MNTLEQLRSGALAGTRRLKLCCGLREFPQEIFALADTLEILDLSGNRLSALPEDLPRLRQLRILFCSDNDFTTLPAMLGQCPRLEMIGFKANRIATLPASALPPALRWLILTDNRLAELPAEIGACTRLRKLMLAGNQLRALPPEMAACTGLELLRVAANQLSALPDWLLALPRLAWLAYAGNPFCAAAEAKAEDSARRRTAVAAIDWQQLTIEQTLGQGASGVIHQASWQRGEAKQKVAVKLFKGEVTSDGLPRHEMNACLGAGEHPNLIPRLGKIARHPAGGEGLLLALIDPGYRNLAGPPDFASCTRDIYAAGTVLTLPQVCRLALDVASAAAHLHAQGILHGDLYGHNILHREGAPSLLGDFGAASFFAPEERPAAALQRIEVRAFACLLEELLAHCPGAADRRRESLLALQAACGQENIGARPRFEEIAARIRAIQSLPEHVPASASPDCVSSP